MNPKYSASRFGTFDSCLAKYKAAYVDELVVEGRDFDVQQKGLCFHKIAEETEVGESYESIYERALKTIDNFQFDKEKYPIKDVIPMFYKFWQLYIEENVSKGFKLYKENWENSTIRDEPLCGAIDVLLVNEDTKEVIIIDYKTGASAHLDGYTNQLLLYAYMMSKKLGIPEDEITSKVKCYLFYPLAGISKAKDADTEEKILKATLKGVISYDFSRSEYEDAISHFEKIVDSTNTMDWTNLDLLENANISFGCSFCAYCGHPDICPLSYKSGLFFPRSAKVMTKAESKALHANDSTN